MPDFADEQDESVHIVSYDAAWPTKFEAERDALRSVLEPWLAGPIEHVGSTAVQGLPAKPVIDIMAAVESLEASSPAIAVLNELSYNYYPHRPDLMHWFCKPSPNYRTHHLHLVPFGSQLWSERIAFRDYLRTHPETARDYADLKYRLAEQHRFDRDAYTDAKEPFVSHVVRMAMRST